METLLHSSDLKKKRIAIYKEPIDTNDDNSEPVFHSAHSSHKEVLEALELLTLEYKGFDFFYKEQEFNTSSNEWQNINNTQVYY